MIDSYSTFLAENQYQSIYIFLSVADNWPNWMSKRERKSYEKIGPYQDSRL